MKGRTLTLLALLGFALLAGCSAKSAGTATQSLAPTATTGSIRGVVVDSAIRPLPGVLVTLRAGADKTSTVNTTASGLFRFDGVPAGSQVLKAHRTGYLDVQLPVQVEAAIAEPNETKVTLAIDPSYQKPFVQPFQYKGIMECSAVVNAPAPVGRAAVAACALPGQTTGQSTPVEDKFLVVHTLDSGKPRFVQSELVWEASGPFAGSLLLYMDERNHTASPTVGTTGAQTGYSELEHAAGPSPVIVHVQDEAVDRLGRGYDLQLRVFAWYQDPVPVGAVFQQSFTLYSTAFYGFAPPEGWSFAKEGKLPDIPPT